MEHETKDIVKILESVLIISGGILISFFFFFGKLMHRIPFFFYDKKLKQGDWEILFRQKLKRYVRIKLIRLESFLYILLSRIYEMFLKE